MSEEDKLTPTNPRPSAIPPQEPMTPAQEFASVVGNMLDAKLNPLVQSLENLANGFAQHNERIQRLEREPKSTRRRSDAAVLISLLAIGGLFSLLWVIRPGPAAATTCPGVSAAQPATPAVKPATGSGE